MSTVEEIVIEHVLGLLEYVEITQDELASTLNVPQFLHDAAEETFKMHVSDGSEADKLDAIIDILYYIANAATKQAWHGFGFPDDNVEYMYKSVMDFTKGSGYAVPDTATDMNEGQIKFICKMIINELAEYLCAMYGNDHDRVITRIDEVYLSFLMVQTRTPEHHLTIISQELIKIAIGSWGDKVMAAFDIVHGANMAKRFPDGTFHKREDGKIIKPDGWQEPDLKKLFSAEDQRTI